MFSLSAVAAFALLPAFVAAQAADPALEIRAIKAHFTNARIVPDYFETFDPVATLSLDYAGNTLTPGEKVVKEAVGPTPVITVTPANASVTLAGTYTLAMIDVDIVGADLSVGVTRHWLVNGVTIEGTTVSNTSATAITPYAGPWPAAGSGPHRYIVALYEQPEAFAAPEGFTETLPVGPYDFKAYVENSNLGSLVAANYINVEEGTATVSLVATSAVVTSSLVTSSPAPTGTGNTTANNNSGGNKGAAGNDNGALKQALSPVAALVMAGMTFLAL